MRPMQHGRIEEYVTLWSIANDLGFEVAYRLSRASFESCTSMKSVTG